MSQGIRGVGFGGAAAVWGVSEGHEEGEKDRGWTYVEFGLLEFW
jgi:hypothetical protein